MRRAESAPRRGSHLAAATRWHISVRRAYLKLAERGAADYALIQCRMHWKTWSTYR